MDPFYESKDVVYGLPAEIAVFVNEFLIVFHFEVALSELDDYWAFHGTTLLDW